MTDVGLSAFPVVCPICGEQIDCPYASAIEGFDIGASPLVNHLNAHLAGGISSPPDDDGA